MAFFKNFLLRQAMKVKMKNVPEAQRDQMLELMERNPEFFQKIGEEVQKLVKTGQSETTATLVVMRKHQAELQKLMRR